LGLGGGSGGLTGIPLRSGIAGGMRTGGACVGAGREAPLAIDTAWAPAESLVSWTLASEDDATRVTVLKFPGDVGALTATSPETQSTHLVNDKQCLECNLNYLTLKL
jgi:hypothetical protein